MKYMIVSDIHGDAECTAKFLSIFEREKCQGLIILGDILYHGPRNDLPSGYAPKRVIEMLNQLKESIIAIKGNCDAEVDEMVLQFPILSDPQFINLNGKRTLLTHGHKYDFDDIDGKETDLILHGHTHLLRIESDVSGATVVNPGSVSIPKGGNANTFAIFDENEITIMDFGMNVILSTKF